VPNTIKEPQATNPLPTTPFTFSELQSLNLEDEAFRARLKKDLLTRNFAHRNKPNSSSGLELPRNVNDRVNKIAENLISNPNNTNPLFKADTGHAQSLNRLISYSDTHINYQANYKDIEEASGSSGLINLDGSLNLNMVLKGLHSVILKENSLKLCELTLFILENLMNIDIMPSEEIDKKLEHAKKNLDLSQSACAFLDDLEVSKKIMENVKIINFYLIAPIVQTYGFNDFESDSVG